MIDFNVSDEFLRIIVKFVPAYLPEAKKPYNLKPVYQPELDIHGIASKADIYNIQTSPKVIEEGMTAGFQLMLYLAANGYKITTPLFTLKARVPGEYGGSETRLPDGIYPVVRMQPSARLRNYIKNNVQVQFDGVDGSSGIIAEALDEAATIGNILTVRGSGFKIEADDANKDEAGFFFVNRSNGDETKASVIAVNEPRTLKVVVPALADGVSYTLVIRTQGSARSNGHLLKKMREMRSDFAVTAMNG